MRLLRHLLVSLLLVTLGLVMGFRYANEGSLFGMRIGWFDQLLTQRSNQTLAELIKSSSNSPVSMQNFWEVWQLLERDYLEADKIDRQKMMEGAIAGMVGGLGDPYTMYLPKEENAMTQDDLAGSFFGVGIELAYIDGMVGVLAPLAGSPAEKAGLLAGDIITHVADAQKQLDEDTTAWTLDTAVKHIRGPKGTPIVLTIYRKGESDTREITVVRDEIVVKSVTLEFPTIDGKTIAHLKLSRFGERTLDEWNSAVRDILARRSSISGVVLDLRNNPGGFFDVSIDVASDFVKRGVIVSQKSKYNVKNYNSTGTGRLAELPTLVLVNRGSASASEIVAGALRDDLGTKLIGEKTFGKGTVQDRRELRDGSGLHITVGRWLTPSGGWIHDDGLEVDIEVKQDHETEEDEVLIRAVQEF